MDFRFAAAVFVIRFVLPKKFKFFGFGTWDGKTGEPSFFACTGWRRDHSSTTQLTTWQCHDHDHDVLPTGPAAGPGGRRQLGLQFLYI